MPFEVPFYEEKHHYKIHYVGNPTVHEVYSFLKAHHGDFKAFCKRHQMADDKPFIALLPGSRKQEIKDNLPAMITASARYADRFKLVLACAPAIEDAFYQEIMERTGPAKSIVSLVKDDTYALLSHATAALVTSGTATLETALLHVPQVVCYKTPVPRLIRWAFNHVLSCRYISLVNLIADRDVVAELFADRFTTDNIATELARLLPGGTGREAMLKAYQEVEERLGNEVAPDNAARLMVNLLRQEADCCP